MGVNNPTVTAGGGAPAAAPYVKSVSPTTGQTVAFDANSTDQTLYLTPAGTLATLTITMPSDASSALGQTVTIAASQTLTALTINGATIVNTATTLLGSSAVAFRKVAANTWMQI